jgi:hypothetical protein
MKSLARLAFPRFSAPHSKKKSEKTKRRKFECFRKWRKQTHNIRHRQKMTNNNKAAQCHCNDLKCDTFRISCFVLKLGIC